MAKLVINSYEEFASHLGEKLGESDWLQIDQERINKFADATLDPQWIHVDVERAKVESPYHSTIAHGYLTLSVLPYLWQQILEVNNHVKYQFKHPPENRHHGHLACRCAVRRCGSAYPDAHIRCSNDSLGTARPRHRNRVGADYQRSILFAVYRYRHRCPAVRAERSRHCPEYHRWQGIGKCRRRQCRYFYFTIYNWPYRMYCQTNPIQTLPV